MLRVPLQLRLPVALLIAFVAVSARADLPATFRALSRPTIEGTIQIETRELRLGRGLLKLGPDAVVSRMSAEGQPIGLLVHGPMILTYTVDDRFSIPLLRNNFKRAFALRSPNSPELKQAESSAILTLRLSELALWTLEPGILALPLSPAPAAPLPAWATSLLVDLVDDDAVSDYLLARQDATTGYLWALASGPSGEFRLRVDPRTSVNLESLARLRRIDRDAGTVGGKLTVETLAVQPVSGAWFDSRTLDLVSLATELDVANTAGENVTISTTTTLQSLRDGLAILPLILLDGFDDQNGRRRDHRIQSLEVDGVSAAYVHSRGRLLVELPRPLDRGGMVTLKSRSASEMLLRPEGNSYWLLGTFPWYPRPETWGGEHSSFTLRVEAADPFVPIVPGAVTTREKTASGTRVSSSVPGPMGHLAVIAGKYTMISEEHEGRRVHVWSYAHPKEESARNLARMILSVSACLGDWLGVPYPFQDLQVVELQDWGWGQAPPGVIFITREAFLTRALAEISDENREMAPWYTRGINERVAHEVAHAWFPHVAKIARNEDAWLSESFADYAAAVCLQKTMSDKSQAKYFFTRQVAEWKSRGREAGENSSIFLYAHLGDTEHDIRTRYHLLYGKGPLVLHALRQELGRQAGSEAKGDELFMTWMRSYVRNFTYKFGETRHLVGILNQMTGKDWQPWFEKYVYGTETPKVD